MQNLASRLRQSASVKVFTIGLLILVLLIPLQMVRGTINERSMVHETARIDIQRTWGQSQTVAGPILVLPYDVVRVNGRGDRVFDRTEMYLLPSELNIIANVEPEIRYRGIHEVPVYSATVSLTGQFAAIDVAEFGIDADRVHWADAFVVVGASDGRSITEAPVVELNGRSTNFAPRWPVGRGVSSADTGSARPGNRGKPRRWAEFRSRTEH